MDGLQEKSMLRVLKMMAVLVTAFSFFLAAELALADGGTAMPLKTKDISGVLKEAQEKAKDLRLPDDGQADGCGCREAAGKIMEKFEAPEHQARIQEERQRLQESLYKNLLPGPMPQAYPDSLPKTAAGGQRLYLFVSSSMPMATLRNYAASIARAEASGITMVMRGFVGGMKKIHPTMEFIGAVLKKNPDCDFTKEKCDSFQVNIQVDPELFQKLQIKEVPALAYLPGIENETETAQADAMIVYGDAGLDYLLEKINREAQNAGIDRLIAALRGGKLAK